jgi:hypothetical protein
MRTMDDAAAGVLFDNLLDALDRLADRKCGAADVEALAFATAKAVTPHPVTPLLTEAAAALDGLRRRGLTPEQVWNEALAVTQSMRSWLAEDWDRRWSESRDAAQQPPR